MLWPKSVVYIDIFSFLFFHTFYFTVPGLVLKHLLENLVSFNTSCRFFPFKYDCLPHPKHNHLCLVSFLVNVSPCVFPMLPLNFTSYIFIWLSSCVWPALHGMWILLLPQLNVLRLVPWFLKLPVSPNPWNRTQLLMPLTTLTASVAGAKRHFSGDSCWWPVEGDRMLCMGFLSSPTCDSSWATSACVIHHFRVLFYLWTGNTSCLIKRKLPFILAALQQTSLHQQLYALSSFSEAIQQWHSRWSWRV